MSIILYRVYIDGILMERIKGTRERPRVHMPLVQQYLSPVAPSGSLRTTSLALPPSESFLVTGYRQEPMYGREKPLLRDVGCHGCVKIPRQVADTSH